MKIILAHPFQQHSFKTAAALKEENILYKYITTVYQKKKSLTSLISFFLKNDDKIRANNRKCDALNDEDVVLLSEWMNLLLLLLYRIDSSKKIYNWWYWKTIDRFNKNLYKYVKKNKVDGVIVYDTVSYSFIKLVKQKKLDIKIILDMSAPNLLYAKQIFEKEFMENSSLYNEITLDDINTPHFNKKYEAAKYEINNSDAFLVASEFTRESLEWSGISKEKIHKCVYGIYKEIPSKINKKQDKKIKCVYMGKISLQKGAYRLFEVINLIKRDDMEFHFYGNYKTKSNYYENMKKRCTFHGHIPHKKMLEELEKSDVIIFPSFADGFGLSVSESLLYNNIAICSNNAGVSELIKKDENGYVFEPNDTHSLVNILNGLVKEKIKQMQINAPKSIKKYTEKNYKNSLIKALKNIIGE